MLATPHGKTLTHVIKASPQIVDFLKRMRHDAELHWDEPVYMVGIPVEEDSTLGYSQWRAYSENGELLLEGGEPE